MLLKRLLIAASDENDLVFDPFMGSGTTAVAAKELGRKFVGCELDPHFVSVAMKRLSSSTQYKLLSSY
jgi:site-specific DNA-methyltransferase (adenine-specific)